MKAARRPGRRDYFPSNSADSEMTRTGQRSMNRLIPNLTGPLVDERDYGLLLDQVSRVDSAGLVFLCGGVLTSLAIITIGRLLREPAPADPILCVLFFIVCLFFLTICLRTIRGAEQLRLDSGGLEYRWTFGLARWRRWVPLDEIKGISMYVRQRRRSEPATCPFGVWIADRDIGPTASLLSKPPAIGRCRREPRPASRCGCASSSRAG